MSHLTEAELWADAERRAVKAPPLTEEQRTQLRRIFAAARAAQRALPHAS